MVGIDWREWVRFVIVLYGLPTFAYLIAQILLGKLWVRRVSAIAGTSPIQARLARGPDDLWGFSFSALGFSLQVTVVMQCEKFLSGSHMVECLGLEITVVLLLLTGVTLLVMQCYASHSMYLAQVESREKAIGYLVEGNDNDARSAMRLPMSNKLWRVASVTLGIVSISTTLYVVFGRFLDTVAGGL